MNIKNFLKDRWFGRGVIILWLISSVFVLVLLRKIDGIVHGTLYSYGLRFDYGWAQPYWFLLSFAFVSLAFPMILGGIVLFFSFLRTGHGETRLPDRSETSAQTRAQTSAQTSARTSARASAQTSARALRISCSSCKKVFGKPLVLLDFSRGKERLVNVCPYCNAVLGSAKEKHKPVDVVVDLRREVVDEEELDH